MVDSQFCRNGMSRDKKEEKQRYFAKNAGICIGELMIE